MSNNFWHHGVFLGHGCHEKVISRCPEDEFKKVWKIIFFLSLSYLQLIFPAPRTELRGEGEGGLSSSQWMLPVEPWGEIKNLVNLLHYLSFSVIESLCGSLFFNLGGKKVARSQKLIQYIRKNGLRRDFSLKKSYNFWEFWKFGKKFQYVGDKLLGGSWELHFCPDKHSEGKEFFHFFRSLKLFVVHFWTSSEKIQDVRWKTFNKFVKISFYVSKRAVFWEFFYGKFLVFFFCLLGEIVYFVWQEFSVEFWKFYPKCSEEKTEKIFSSMEFFLTFWQFEHFSAFWQKPFVGVVKGARCFSKKQFVGHKLLWKLLILFLFSD